MMVISKENETVAELLVTFLVEPSGTLIYDESLQRFMWSLFIILICDVPERRRTTRENDGNV